MSAVTPEAHPAAPPTRTGSRVHAPSDRTATLAIVAIVALAAFVRIRLAWLTPLWSDEIFTLWILRGGTSHALVVETVTPSALLMRSIAFEVIADRSDWSTGENSVVNSKAVIPRPTRTNSRSVKRSTELDPV